jgi:hypothetical protein
VSAPRRVADALNGVNGVSRGSNSALRPHEAENQVIAARRPIGFVADMRDEQIRLSVRCRVRHNLGRRNAFPSFIKSVQQPQRKTPPPIGGVLVCRRPGRAGTPGRLRRRLPCGLLRAYAAQVEALRRLRNGNSQTVRVEHVHVNEGGQAIIGNVRSGTAGEQKMQPRQSGRRGRPTIERYCSGYPSVPGKLPSR